MAKQIKVPMAFPSERVPGTYSQGPATKEDAEYYNLKHHQADPCYTCYVNSGIEKADCLVYVKSGQCPNCAVQDAGNTYNVIHEKWITPYGTTKEVKASMGIPSLGVVKHGGNSVKPHYQLSAMGLVQYNHIIKEFPDGLPEKREHCGNGDGFFLIPYHCDDCGGCGLVEKTTGTCHWCRELEATKTSPRKLALSEGKKWYPMSEPCRQCSVVSEKSTDTGACKNCRDIIKASRAPSPITNRTRAKADGKRWFKPEAHCEVCNTHAPKRIKDGDCFACCNPGRYMAINNKDMVLPKDNAAQFGFDVYREDGGEWKFVANNRRVKLELPE